MRAIIITRPGPPSVLEARDIATPTPAQGQILVRVHATAVNRADLLQRQSRYPAPPGSPQSVPGLEYAGTVEAASADVTRWQRGDRVMGLVGGGSYAEYIVTHEDEAVRIPDDMDFDSAAAVPEAFITAHDALFTQMRLQRGETLLVHAVGSGVGTAALQLAREAGARVIGTQRSRWKLDRAVALGLDVAIDASTDDFVAAALRETAGRGVDGVLDLVGGDYLGGDLEALAVRGRILLVGLVAGAKTQLDMRALLTKRATLIGTVLRARSLDEKIEVARAFDRAVLPLLAAGTIRPIIDDVLPLEAAARAHAVVGENRNFGKIVLRVVAQDS
jgi:NADPH:quinone reductase